MGFGGNAVPEEPHASFRGDIQGLRAVAVLSVVLGHAGIVGLSGGFVGVDVFFVISGYLITGVLVAGISGGRVQLSEFFAKRAKRILPAAAFVLISTATAAALLLNPVRAGEVFRDSAWAAGFLANVKFAHDGTDYFSKGEPLSVLQHYWSLAVEEQFYLVWPVLLALLVLAFNRRRRSALPTPAITVVLVLVTGVSLAYSLWETRRSPTPAYFSTPGRSWELGLGALLSAQYAAVRRLAAPLRAAVSWVGLGMIGTAIVLFDASTAFPGKAALLPVAGAVLVIAGGIGSPRGGASELLARQPLRWFGDISFSLYLWHWPLLQIAELRSGKPLSLTVRLELLALAVCLSAISYYGLENPFRRARWAREPARALILWPASLIAVLMVAQLGPGFVQPPTRSVLPVVAAAATRADASGNQSDGVIAGVEQAARAVMAGRRVPAELTPPLSLLGEDALGLGGCIATNGSSTVLQCALGDQGASRSMLLFGDSHAAMWLPALDAIGKREHWAVTYIVKNGCTPMKVHLYYSNTGIVRDCDAWREKALSRIKADPAQLIIVGSMMYSNYADDAGHPTPVPAVLQSWSSGVEATTSELVSASRRVVVIGDPRPMSSLPVDCLGRPSATLRDCSVPLTGDLHYTLSEATREAARAHNAAYIDVNPWFCADQVCPEVINGTIVFRDLGHVTRSYVTTLNGVLQKALALPKT